MQAAGGGPWYTWKFATTPLSEAAAGDPRRRVRDALGWYLRRGVSTLKSVRQCGLFPLPGSEGESGWVSLKLAEFEHDGETGVTAYAGVRRCGSTWACPSCAAKIRHRKSEEIATAFGGWVGEGHGAELVTLTLSHHRADELGQLVGLVTDSFRAVRSGGAATREKKRLGIVGDVRAFEVTHGANGWHPHLHVLVATEQPLSEGERDQLRLRWQRSWDRELTKAGWSASRMGIGVRVDAVWHDAEAVGRYVAKVQEGSSVGNELARGDLKSGRAKGRTPMQILQACANGEVRDIELWREYEQATKGKSAIRWTPGLRDRLQLGEEQSDEELAAEEAGGVEAVRMTQRLWAEVRRRPMGETGLFEVMEAAGQAGDDVLVAAQAYVAEVTGSALGVLAPLATPPPDE